MFVGETQKEHKQVIKWHPNPHLVYYSATTNGKTAVLPWNDALVFVFVEFLFKYWSYSKYFA